MAKYLSQSNRLNARIALIDKYENKLCTDILAQLLKDSNLNHHEYFAVPVNQGQNHNHCQSICYSRLQCCPIIWCKNKGSQSSSKEQSRKVP